MIVWALRSAVMEEDDLSGGGRWAEEGGEETERARILVPLLPLLLLLLLPRSGLVVLSLCRSGGERMDRSRDKEGEETEIGLEREGEEEV